MTSILQRLSPRRLLHRGPITDKLRFTNNILTLIVIALGLYIIVLPFLPQVELYVARATDSTDGFVYRSQLAETANVDSTEFAEPPEDERLVIPGIQLDEPLVLGDDPANVHRGVWHRPRTSTPDQGGNTVLVGHRFSYDSPATFYHLDKMAEGDRFAIWWEGKEYIYEVFTTSIVAPSAIEVEANTEEPIATLYTCTPVWTATERLVIKGRLVNTEVLQANSVGAIEAPSLGVSL